MSVSSRSSRLSPLRVCLNLMLSQLQPTHMPILPLHLILPSNTHFSQITFHVQVPAKPRCGGERDRDEEHAAELERGDGGRNEQTEKLKVGHIKGRKETCGG